MRRVLLLMLLAVFATVSLAVPNVFSYQGKLTTPDGVGINDTLDITINIYDGSDILTATLLSTDDLTDVPVVLGLFDIQYDVDLDQPDLMGDLYMELVVDGSAFDPLIRLATVPFAMSAQYTDSAYYAVVAESLGTFTAADLMPNDLEGAYNEGGPGAGKQINALDGPVDIRTAYVGPGDGRALELRTNDITEPALYAYNAGAGPAIFCSGDLRMNGDIWSNDDVSIQLDKNVSASDEMFYVKNDTGVTVFSVDEHGDAMIFGELDLKAVVFQPQIVVPAGAEGKVYYDDAEGKLKWHDGTSWQDFGSGGVGTHSLQDAYDDGNAIVTTGGNAVSITAGTGTALYVTSPDANGIWNDANYWAPTGNIALGTGFYHTDNGLFQSNTDFIAKLDANDDEDANFIVRNSVDTDLFWVDEDGDVYVTGFLNVSNITNPDGDSIWIDEKLWVEELVTDTIESRGDVVFLKDAFGIRDSLWFDGEWRKTWPTGGTGGDFIEDQYTAPQVAQFWIEHEGAFGVDMAATEIDIWTDDFEDGDISDWDTTSWVGMAWTILNPDGRSENGGCTGEFLIIDDDYAGSGVDVEGTALSPVIDLSSYVGEEVYLELNHYFDSRSFYDDFGALDVFDGTSWVPLDEFVGATFSGLLNYDISAYVNANFQVRAYFNDLGDWGYYWMLDNFRIYEVEYSSPAPKIVADGPNGNVELLTTSGDVIFNGTGLTTTGGAGIVGYDNATSGLGAGDVQAAIDELAATPVVTKLDTLWAGDLGDVSDTIYAMDNFRINGELIVDSIQAVGDSIYFDDHLLVDEHCATIKNFIGSPPAVLLNEDFETAFPPTGWTNTIGGDASSSGWQWDATSSHGGTYSAWHSDDDVTTTCMDYLVTPMLDCTPAVDLTLAFWDDNYYAASTDSCAVLVSTNSATGPWTGVWELGSSDRNWGTEVTIDLGLYDGEPQLWIAFYYEGDYANEWNIDDIRVYYSTGGSYSFIDLCNGNITADGDIEGGTFTLDGVTITEWPTPPIEDLDTLWMSSGLTTDTMVAMAQFKVFGELIADSIQAAGSMISMDDSVDFNYAVSLAKDSTFRSDWEAQHVITVGFQNADFMTIDEALNAISINGWTHALIDVAPGIFPAGMLVIPRGVHLRGSGAGVTEIIGQVQVNGLLSRLKVTNPGPTVIQGDVSHCHFECPIMAGDALGNTSISDCVFRGSDLLQLMETGRIENSNIYMGISGEGSWSIKNCELYGRVTVQKMAAPITEFHITGCDFSNSLTIIGDLVFVYLDASYFHFGDGAAVQVDENAFLEAKANHFVDCITGISIGSGGSAVILSNDFTANIMFGVSASSAFRVDIIGNSFVSRTFMQTAISLNMITDQAIIKDNVIEGCLADAVSINVCPINTPIDNNMIKNSVGNGIVLQGVIAQVLRNTLINNGDGASSFDLFDMTPMGTVASYNVLDSYFPVGSGAFPGAFNTNTMGAIWAGIQTGQLP